MLASDCTHFILKHLKTRKPICSWDSATCDAKNFTYLLYSTGMVTVAANFRLVCKQTRSERECNRGPLIFLDRNQHNRRLEWSGSNSTFAGSHDSDLTCHVPISTFSCTMWMWDGSIAPVSPTSEGEWGSRGLRKIFVGHMYNRNMQLLTQNEHNHCIFILWLNYVHQKFHRPMGQWGARPLNGGSGSPRPP